MLKPHLRPHLSLLGVVGGILGAFVLIWSALRPNLTTLAGASEERSVGALELVGGSAKYDFGAVDIEHAQSELRCVFRLKNISDVPLRILPISTTCGCTAARVEREVIAPGEIAEVSAVLHILDVGAKSAQIFVRHDLDPEHRVVLTVAGTGWRARQLLCARVHVDVREKSDARVDLHLTDYNSSSPLPPVEIEVSEGIFARCSPWRCVQPLQREGGLPARWESTLVIGVDHSFHSPSSAVEATVGVHVAGIPHRVIHARILREEESVR